MPITSFQKPSSEPRGFSGEVRSRAPRNAGSHSIFLNLCRLLIILALLACGLVSIRLVMAGDTSVVLPLGDDFIVVPLTDRMSPSQDLTPTGFDYVRKNERILTGFPVGHNLPKATNQLFYNLELDGYGGLPFGSCLRRGYLLDNTNSTKAVCTANENRDLMRVWANRNPNLKNVLLKNMTIKNAFRTYNVVDGEVVTNSGDLPHTDAFQMYYSGRSEEDPDWLGIQDTVIKNSDNSLMITGGSKFDGAVYQNLHTLCDTEFAEDDRRRHENDARHFFPDEEVRPSYSCTNSITFHSVVPATVWLIDVKAGTQGDSGIQILNELAPVIAVGAESQGWRILTREDRGKPIQPHPNVRHYPTIEAALALESRPPFIALSCSGWANPPANCESRLGYLN